MNITSLFFHVEMYQVSRSRFKVKNRIISTLCEVLNAFIANTVFYHIQNKLFNRFALQMLLS